MSVVPTQMKLVETNRAGKAVPKRREGFYVLPGDRVYVSVTTFLGVIDKPFLRQWFAKVSCEALMEDPSISLEEACSAPNRHRDKAGDAGSTFHSFAEAYQGGYKWNVPLIEPKLGVAAIVNPNVFIYGYKDRLFDVVLHANIVSLKF